MESDVGGTFRKIRWAVIVPLCVLPAIFALALIHAYGVNVVFQDEFAMAPLFEKYHEGRLAFADFYRPHNEHRLFFPRLLLLWLGLATNLNTVVEMYVGWGFLCLSALPVFFFCRRLYTDRQTACVAFIPAAWILFNLRQSENLLWGWQMLFFMSVAFFMLSMYCLEKARRLDGWLLAAAAAAVVATYSFSSMLLVWPIGLLMILMNRRFREAASRRRMLTALSFWGALAAAVWLTYFVGLSQPKDHPSFLYGLTHPQDFLRYLSLYFANPLGHKMEPATVIGFLLLASYLVSIVLACWQWRVRDPLPVLPIAMILFAVGSAIITAVARVGFGPEQALAPRYVTFSSLGIVGLYLTFLSLEPRFQLRVKELDARPILMGLMLLFLVYPMYGTGAAKLMCINRSRVAYLLYSAPFQSDQTLLDVSNDAEFVRSGEKIMRRYKLNVFSGEPTDFAAMQPSVEAYWQYEIDAVNNQGVGPSRRIRIAEKAHSVTIRGWAVDETAGRPVRAVFAELDGRLDIPGYCGFSKPDVGKRFASNHHLYGFEIRFSKTLLKRARHTLRLKMVSADGASYYLAPDAITLELP